MNSTGVRVCLRVHLCVFVLQLLTVNPEHRFSSLSLMQTSPYLAHVNWDAVYEKKMDAGFVPNVSCTKTHTHTCTLASCLWLSHAHLGGRVKTARTANAPSNQRWAERPPLATLSWGC